MHCKKNRLRVLPSQKPTKRVQIVPESTIWPDIRFQRENPHVLAPVSDNFVQIFAVILPKNVVRPV